MEKYQDKVQAITGRKYGMFAYDGAPGLSRAPFLCFRVCACMIVRFRILPECWGESMMERARPDGGGAEQMRSTWLC